MMFINRSKSSPKKKSYSISVFLPREHPHRENHSCPHPQEATLSRPQIGGFAMCFFPPTISSFLAIPLLNLPCLSSKAELQPTPPVKPSLTYPDFPKLPFLWVRTTLTGERVTISRGCGHRECYVEKDSETETTSRTSRKSATKNQSAWRGCQQ